MNICMIIKSYLFPKTIILLYHRIANVQDDPHLLSVKQKNFKKHISYLKSNYQIIPLDFLVENLKKNKVPKKSVVITFDDGYVDNYYHALPILKGFNVPATIFAVSGKIGAKKPFYWDKETRKQDKGRPLTKRELIKLSKSRLIEIGSHTVNHLPLSNLNIKQQRGEILESKTVLENIIKTKVKHFSYPFGTNNDYNKQTIRIVKRGSFISACANFRGMVTKRSDIYQLPRFIVRDWNLEEFKKNIGRFFTKY